MLMTKMGRTNSERSDDGRERQRAWKMPGTKSGTKGHKAFVEATYHATRVSPKKILTRTSFRTRRARLMVSYEIYTDVQQEYT